MNIVPFLLPKECPYSGGDTSRSAVPPPSMEDPGLLLNHVFSVPFAPVSLLAPVAFIGPRCPCFSHCPRCWLVVLVAPVAPVAPVACHSALVCLALCSMAVWGSIVGDSVAFSLPLLRATKCVGG